MNTWTIQLKNFHVLHDNINLYGKISIYQHCYAFYTSIRQRYLMTYKTLFFILCLIIVSICIFYAIQEYKKSGRYIDETFSNRMADNKQFPFHIEGDCFGGTDLLSAKVIRETSSSLLLYVTYCNKVVSDRAVLGIWISDGSVADWSSTPGGTVAGHGGSYVRLQVSNLEQPITVSDYTIKIYGNNSGKEIISYPFHYEKVWCNGTECKD